MRCAAYSFARELIFTNLHKYLADHYELTVYENVIHIKITEPYLSSEEGDVFIFPYGAVVFWGLNEKHESELNTVLKKFLGSRLGGEDDDLYTYGYGDKHSIKDDHIILPGKDISYKLACSYGIAQSVKLGGFEETVDKIIEETQDLPENLAQNGSIHLSRKQMRKLMGKIFVERTSINLHLKLLDVPNLFWEHIELEPLYEMIIEYMAQKQRVGELNRQLAVMHEMLEMLGNELNSQHSSNLEWIIILLIFVEVVLTLAKDFFHLI